MNKIKINKRYINEALRIREEYLKSLTELKKKEKCLVKIKNDINDAYNMVSDTVNNKIMENKINILTKEIKNLNEYIQPITNKIDKLKDEANDLYMNIKESSPNITKEDIKKIFLPHIKKIDNKFSSILED